MKKHIHRVLTLLLSLCLLAGLLPLTAVPSNAASGGGVSLALNALRTGIFSAGRHWNHQVDRYEDSCDCLEDRGDEYFAYSTTVSPCNIHGGKRYMDYTGMVDCNYFDGACQCEGFARLIFYHIFGERVTQLPHRTDKEGIRPGDYVRFCDPYNSECGHAFVVLEKNGDWVKALECNIAGDNCVIRWDWDYNLNWSYDMGGSQCSFSFYVRANNYDEKNEVCKALKNSGKHNYEVVKQNGVWVARCASCKEVFTLGAIDTAYAGLYKVQNENKAKLCPAPYTDSAKLDSTTRLTATEQKPVEVVGGVINAFGNLWYKTASGYYIYSGWVTKAGNSSSKLQISMGKNNYTLKEGDALTLSGAVSSNYAIKSVKAIYDGVVYAEEQPNTTSFSLAGSRCSSGFSTSGRGREAPYTIRIEATDASGRTVNTSVSVYVTAVTPVSEPEIVFRDDKVTITQHESNALLYYSYSGTGGSFISTDQRSVTFPLTEESSVTAYSVRKSDGRESSRTYRQINQLPTPKIQVEPLPDGARVTLSCDLAATIRYDVGADVKTYTAPFVISEDATVRAYAVRNDYVTSPTASTRVRMTPPAAPAPRLSESGRVAAETPVTLSWPSLGNAGTYSVKTELDGAQLDLQEGLTECSASFVLTQPGEYRFYVRAENAFGESAWSAAQTVTAVAPSTVRFYDHDGTLLSSQLVRYGDAAATPEEPSRRGYIFKKWDVSFDRVLADLDVHAVYQIISYRVTFLDGAGNRIGPVQTIDFDHSATQPDRSTFSAPSENYEFVGWSVSATASDSACDLDHVDSDMTAQAVFRWTAGNEIPIVISDLNATFDPDTSGGLYSVTVTMENTNEQFTRALLRIALKTRDEDGVLKMVDTESRTVALRAGSSQHTESFTFSYAQNAAVVEAVVVGYEYSTRTGPSYSVARSAEVQTVSGYVYGQPTEWSETNPSTLPGMQIINGVLTYQGYPVEIESKTQYGYRTRTNTSSNKKYLSGWTRDDSKTITQYTDWTDAGYTRTEPTESDTLRIVSSKTRTVEDTSGYTIFNYYHYYGWNESGVLYNSYGSGWWPYYEEANVTYEFPYYSTFDGYPTYSQSISGKNGSLWWKCPNYTTWVPGTSHTEWFYQTRTKYKVYSFYQLSDDITAWEDSKIADTDTSVFAQTRTVYRYRLKDQAVTGGVSDAEQDTNGVVYTVSNCQPASEEHAVYTPYALPAAASMDLEGKVATLMVYRGKNADPNESQMQYVGQTVIGEDNSFSFTFRTKNEPDENTGDFIVALSVQGSVGLVNIGLIPAPAKTYTVTYLGEDGGVLSTQSVAEGENAHAPEAPAVTGMRFVGWTESGTNVRSDMNISARYIPQTCTVAFVDDLNGTAELYTADYGTLLSELAEIVSVPVADGHRFLGWDLQDDEQLTDNRVVWAQYQAETFTVRFHDNGTLTVVNGERDMVYQTISTQQVEFGQSAALPEAPAVDGMIFLGWSTDACWWNVTDELDVYPIYIYENDAAAPRSPEGKQIAAPGARSITLTAEEGASIYYTLDGSEPTTGSLLYEGPIQVEENTLIRAISIVPGKNDSQELFVDFFRMPDRENILAYTDLVELGTYQLTVQPGETVPLKVQARETTDLIGWLITVECDRDVFCLDYDDALGDFLYTPGEAASDGFLLCGPYNDTGWQLMWFSTGAACPAGQLFELPLHVLEDAEPGTYPIRVSYSPSNTVSVEDLAVTEEEHVRSIMASLFGDGVSLLGDVNGDEKISSVDVIRIARYVIGDFTPDNAAHFCTAADVTGDGSVTNADVIRLARYMVGLAALGATG